MLYSVHETFCGTVGTITLIDLKCDIIRKNLGRYETNKNGRGDTASFTQDRR